MAKARWLARAKTSRKLEFNAICLESSSALGAILPLDIRRLATLTSGIALLDFHHLPEKHMATHNVDVGQEGARSR